MLSNEQKSTVALLSIILFLVIMGIAILFFLNRSDSSEIDKVKFEAYTAQRYFYRKGIKLIEATGNITFSE